MLDDAAAVARAGAEALSEVVLENPAAVLALPTGRTMIPFYAELRSRFREGRLDFSRTHAFNLDELVLPRSHPASFFSYMEQHAWERIGLDRTRCEILEGEAEDVEAECRRYERAIAAGGPFDLVILGVGSDGHVAYNLPGAVAEATHEVHLPEAVAENLGIGAEHRPLRALTMGMGPLRRARRLLLMATGGSKARAVEALLQGSEDPRWPCSLLREHPSFDVLLDRAAAGMEDL
ncbi:MAG: glucosamine-6-phosphate deaminase [Acidobacteria bacterium]|nr:glucosamine-6-phosphate deaminase [Acidobacteriota bacterium]